MPAQYDASRWVVADNGSRTRVVTNVADYEVEATDAALEEAAEHGVKIGEVEGTGAGGRITKQDVADHIADED